MGLGGLGDTCFGEVPPPYNHTHFSQILKKCAAGAHGTTCYFGKCRAIRRCRTARVIYYRAMVSLVCMFWCLHHPGGKGTTTIKFIGGGG